MQAERVLQIVTTNIGGNRHVRSTPLDPPRIAREVSQMLPVDRHLPTLLAVQEVSSVQFRNGLPQDTGRLLAMELGPEFNFYSAPETDSLTYPHRRAWNNVTYTGAIHAMEGNGIITNLPLDAWPWPSSSENRPGYGHVSPIQTTISGATLYPSGDRNTQPRNLLVAPVKTPFGRVYFMVTHLAAHSDDERRKYPDRSSSQDASQERHFQAEQILGIVRQIREAEDVRGLKTSPIILAGDFNAQVASTEMKALSSMFTIFEPVSPGDSRWTHIKHEVLIDHIMVSDPMGVLGCPETCFIFQGEEVARVTDHFPVVAVFRQ